jgi:hypothetical protein
MERYQTAHEAITQADSRTWVRDGVVYEITKVFTQKRGPGDVLSVDLRATRRGVVVYDDRNNFPNPPLSAVIDGELVADPYLALQQRLEANVELQTQRYRKPHIRRIGDSDAFTGDTLTAYATDDGSIESFDYSNWLEVQAGGALTVNTSNPTEVAVEKGISNLRIENAFLRFPTSSLVSGDVINSYTLSLFGTGTAETNNYTTTLQARVHPGYGAGTPSVDDWIDLRGSGWTGLTLFATFPVASWVQTADTTNDFTSQGAEASINIDGDTDIVIGHSNIGGSVPGSNGASRVYFRSSGQSGTSSDPVLVIDFTTAPQVITPDPVELAFTIPAPTLVGGIDVISPDPVVLEFTIPAPSFTDLLGYQRIEQQSWAGDIFNRIQAGISPYTVGSEAVLWTDPGPYLLSAGESVELTASSTDLVAQWTGHTRDVDPQTSPDPVVQSVSAQTFSATTYNVAMPGTVNEGDGLLVLMNVEDTDGSMAAPSGWTRKLAHSVSTPTMGVYIFVRLAVGDEDGITIPFVNNTSSAAAVQVYRIDNWFEDITDGIAIAGAAAGTSDTPDPAPVQWPWGETSTMVIAFFGMPNGNNIIQIPTGYSTRLIAEIGNDAILASARKLVTGANNENPGTFTAPVSDFWIAQAIAVRGPQAANPVSAADPSGSEARFMISYDDTVGGTTQAHTNIQVSGFPVIKGDEQIVEVNDVDSQDTHSLSTYRNPAQLFRSTGDALTYANLVLSRYKDRHPVITITFLAPAGSAGYNQAKARRVGDRVTLRANDSTGLGIAQDFFIESIHLRAERGRLMEVEYDLSPVL